MLSKSGSPLPGALHPFLCGVLPRIWRLGYWLGVVEGNFPFSPRCRYPVPRGGESKGEGPLPGQSAPGWFPKEGPAGPSFGRFKGVWGEFRNPPTFLFRGCGETGEALPAAEQASLFRGSGTIGGHEQWPGIVLPRRWAKFSLFKRESTPRLFRTLKGCNQVL